MRILPLLIEINNNTSTVETIIDLRRVGPRFGFADRQLMWIQFFTFTFAAWFIKFSLLAFYARLFYLYYPVRGVYLTGQCYEKNTLGYWNIPCGHTCGSSDVFPSLPRSNRQIVLCKLCSCPKLLDTSLRGYGHSEKSLTLEMINGVLTPVFACADERKVQTLNTTGVVISVVSDFVGISLDFCP